MGRKLPPSSMHLQGYGSQCLSVCRNSKIPRLRCGHIDPLLTTTDLPSNEPQECLVVNDAQQLLLSCVFRLLQAGQQRWSQILVSAGRQDFLFFQSLTIGSSIFAGLQGNRDIIQILGARVTIPGLTHIENNFSDLTQLPHFAVYHIIKPSNVIKFCNRGEFSH